MIKISSIICTYNRSDFLSKAISSLIDQTILQENYEIIIIDNCSTDNTRQIVEDFQSKFKNIRYFFEAKQGLSAARNRGIKEAKGELIAYLDDDAIACKGWIEEYINVFNSNPNVNCAGGKIDLIWPNDKEPEWFSERFEGYYGKLNEGNEIKVLKYPKIPYGGNICIRKKIINLIGNFNESLGRKKEALLSNEEVEYVKRIGEYGDILYIPGAFVYHCVLPYRMDKNYILKRFYWQGISDVKIEANNSIFKKLKQIYNDSKQLIKLIKSSIFIKEKDINYLTNLQYFKGRVIEEVIEIIMRR